MSPRPPAAAPQLAGFEHVRLLGSGGFADVHLYAQRMPRRQVAIKVLLADVRDEGARRRFDDEANLMAQLSTHPFIVTIYTADVGADGRPYLVMEYCPHPNLGVRCRTKPFEVAEALRTGIELAGAVETMHRAGIVHRDIKPANVLVTEYRRPALTDFGISAVSGVGGAAQGLSVPWSPPEAFAEHTAPGPSGDVFSLAATVYTLLSGRSPFELPGGDNGHLALARRIETSPLPPLRRPDVPESLERVLATAMAKQPGGRYPTALAFARALQQVQTQLQLPLTQAEVLDDSVPPDQDDVSDDGATRIRSVVTVDPAPGPPPPPQGWATGAVPTGSTAPHSSWTGAVPAPVGPVTATGPGAPPDPAAGSGAVPAASDTVLRGTPDFPGHRLTAPAVEATLHRPVPVDEPMAAAEPARRSFVPMVVGAVVLVAVGLGLAAALNRGDAGDVASGSSSQAVIPVDAVGDPVPEPTALAGTVGPDGVTFTWGNPDPQEGDKYLYRVPDAVTEVPLTSTDETTVTVPPATGGATCLEVLLRRSDGRASTGPATGCVGP